MKILIENSSQEGDIVLDTFMGSGTTGVACMNTNRNIVGIELEESYFDMAKQRIEEATIMQSTAFSMPFNSLISDENTPIIKNIK